MSEIKNFKPGDVIISQEASCDGVYIVTNGLVSISAGEGDRKVELAVLGKGSMFGEMSVIDLKSRSASAVAIQNTEIVHVATSEFHSQIYTLPVWAQLLVQMLVRRLRTANEQILKLKTGDPSAGTASSQEEGKDLVDKDKITAEEIVKDFNK